MRWPDRHVVHRSDEKHARRYEGRPLYETRSHPKGVAAAEGLKRCTLEPKWRWTEVNTCV